MIADRSKPMYDPDDQWVDRGAVKVMLGSFRLAPETFREMLPDRDGKKTMGPFEFTVRYLPGNSSFLDVTVPKEGIHYVHALRGTFLSIVDEVAAEMAETRRDAAPESSVEKRLRAVETGLETIKHKLDALASIIR